MPDDKLTPADPADLRFAIGYALRFTTNGKPHRTASDAMAHLAAQVIAEHLESSGFVVMKKPPAPPHSTHGLRIPLKP